MAKPVNVFIFYAAEDVAYKKAFVRHLKSLSPPDTIRLWYKEYTQSLEGKNVIVPMDLDRRDIVILLISPDFISMEDRWEIDLGGILRGWERNTATVIPILIHPVDAKRTLLVKELFFIDEAISTQTDQDRAWISLIKETVLPVVVKNLSYPSDPISGQNTKESQQSSGDMQHGGSRGDLEGLESLEPDPPANQPFEAYPFISDPGNVEPGAVFTIDVGFSEQLDTTLQQVRSISIIQADPDDLLKVSLMPVGADVTSDSSKKLPLDVDAKVTFRLQAHPTAEEISVVAMYFYKDQPVGMATRIIRSEEKPADNQIQLSVPDDLETGQIDLTAVIRWDKGSGQLRWKLVGKDIDHDEAIDISDTREFAAILSAQLDPNNNQGKAAFNILTNLGQTIAEHMPTAFFKALKTIGETAKRPPRVLLWTDEAYIPWELAYDPQLAINTQKDPILMLQAVIGRWWINDRVISPPPVNLAVQNFSVIASTYDESPDIALLEEAGKERTFLIDNFKAVGVKAEKEAVLNLTGQKPPQNGHVLHLALHGISRPDLNEQEILLEDGNLNANALFGPYSPGDAPAVSFMFMNACQVGTPGQTLGQASGFPGVLLKKGMSGFIAPLWSVNDEQARHFCENFYNKTLGEARPIGEVLLELRQGVDLQTSITELAYIYYGHPALQLTKSTPNGN